MQPERFSKSKKEQREKKLKILSGYADFHWEKGKLYIDKVYVPEYSSAMTIAEAEFEKTWGNVMDKDKNLILWQKEENVDTCARVGRQIWYKHKELKKQVKLESFISYCNRIKVKWYGHTYLEDHGEKGRCEGFYVDLANNCPLTQEQLEIISNCKKEAYKGLSAKIAEIDEAYYTKEITKQERDAQVGAIDTYEYYVEYQNLLSERLKVSPLEKWTKLIPERYFD